MSKLQSVTCERRTYSDSPRVHTHEYAQLIVPLKGALTITLGEQRLDEREEVIYVPPRCTHSFYSAAANQFFVFDIPSTFFSFGKTEFRFNYAIDKRWEAIRTLLFSELGDGGSGTSQRIADLFRYITGLMEPTTRFASLEYMHQNYNTKISLQDLAAIEHYNVTYYCEWFQKQTGQTPLEYIRKLRLDKAKRMLEDSEYSILQIAQEVGYENQATLTQLFRKYNGISPSEFRRESRKRNK